MVGLHVGESYGNLALTITMMNQLYFSLWVMIEGALEGRKLHNLRQPLEAKYLVLILFTSLES